MSSNPTLYLVMGPQGSGKSTQAERLANQLNAAYFEAGEQLRSFALSNDIEAEQVRNLQQRGELVPDRYIETIFSRFFTNNQTKSAIITDGFPRTLEQLHFLKKLAQENDWQVQGILIDITKQTAVTRLLKRAELEHRPDDTVEVIERRLDEYQQETVPVIDDLKQDSQLLTIDGEPSFDEVTKLVFQSLHLNEEA